MAHWKYHLHAALSVCLQESRELEGLWVPHCAVGTLCVPASLGRSSVTPSRPSKQATGTWTRAGTILQQSPQPLGIPARGPRAHTCQALLLLSPWVLLAWQAQSVLPPRLTSSCSRPLPALPEANASLGPRGCKGKPSGIRQLGPHNKTRDGSLEQRKLIFSQFWIKASAGLFFFFSWRPLPGLAHDCLPHVFMLPSLYACLCPNTVL